MASTPSAGTVTPRAKPAANASSPTDMSEAQRLRKTKVRSTLREFYSANGPRRSPEHPSASAAQQLHSLSTLSLPALLQRHVDLNGEIQELDAERQALVYNHHHELIEASDTIQRMKSRAESVDGALDRLTGSLQTIAELTETLASSSTALLADGDAAG